MEAMQRMKKRNKYKRKQNKRIAGTARADARAIRRTGWSFKAGDKCHRNRKI